MSLVSLTILSPSSLSLRVSSCISLFCVFSLDLSFCSSKCSSSAVRFSLAKSVSNDSNSWVPLESISRARVTISVDTPSLEAVAKALLPPGIPTIRLYVGDSDTGSKSKDAFCILFVV